MFVGRGVRHHSGLHGVLPFLLVRLAHSVFPVVLVSIGCAAKRVHYVGSLEPVFECGETFFVG